MSTEVQNVESTQTLCLTSHSVLLADWYNMVHIRSLELENSQAFPNSVVSCCGSEHSSQINFYFYCRIRKNKFCQALNFHVNSANFMDYLFFNFFYQWGIEQFTEWENCMWKIIKEWSFCGLLCLQGCSVMSHIAAAALMRHFILNVFFWRFAEVLHFGCFFCFSLQSCLLFWLIDHMVKSGSSLLFV